MDPREGRVTERGVYTKEPPVTECAKDFLELWCSSDFSPARLP